MGYLARTEVMPKNVDIQLKKGDLLSKLDHNAIGRQLIVLIALETKQTIDLPYLSTKR